MFGYVRADKPQMRICEFDTYQSVYCALCKNIGKNYGKIYSATLNYDFTFLALLGLSITDNACGFEKKHCYYNPLKKCAFCTGNDEIFDFCSASAMIMVHHKLVDNINDGGFFRKIGYGFLKPFAKHAYKKAKKIYPEMAEFFDTQMTLSFQNEKDESCSADRAADPSAKLLSFLFMHFAKDDTEKRILDRLGYCMGRWIYLVDAVDDIEDDLKSGNFNPLKKSYNENESKITDVEGVLNVNISEAARCLDLLEIKRFKDIIYNIVCLGMPGAQKEIINKQKG